MKGKLKFDNIEQSIYDACGFTKDDITEFLSQITGPISYAELFEKIWKFARSYKMLIGFTYVLGMMEGEVRTVERLMRGYNVVLIPNNHTIFRPPEGEA